MVGIRSKPRKDKAGPLARQHRRDYARRLDTDPKLFYDTTDWAELWQQWYLELAPSGKHRWITVKRFARAHTKSTEQFDFLCYLMGPKPAELADEPPYPWLKSGPQDWAKKRETEGWYTDQNLRTFSKEIAQRTEALDALRTAGNKITLNSMARIERLAQQLDKAFGGEFFAEGLTMAANIGRAKQYLMMHGRLIDMMAVAQDLYAKAHGINYAVPDNGFAQLVATAAMAARETTSEQSKAEKLLRSIVVSSMVKSEKFQFPLPKLVTDIITTEGGVVLDDAPPKKLMQ